MSPATPAPSDIVLDRVSRLHPKIIDLTLDRVLWLLERVGRPQDRLPPVVHVAGTNGKGSVVAFLRAMLEAAGRRVHVYTSPHLVRFNERVRVAGDLISDQALIALLEECERANDDRPITFFEITTVAALLAFERTPADIVLLETGLGGRLDATNVLARPLLTVITPISFDHMQYLGETLAKIAAEKAGILKPGVPCILGPQPAEVLAVIEAKARQLSAPLRRHGREWTASALPGRLVFQADGRETRLPLPRLAGAHQIDNAGMALACLPELRAFGLDDGAAARGLKSVQWPARMQRLARGRLAAMLPPGWELWLDGGHNAAAGEAIARHAQGWRERPLHLIFGMLESKDPAGFLTPLAPLAADLHAVAIGGHAALSAEQAAEAARKAGLTATAKDSVTAALAAILAAGERRPGRILICGSLYLAGLVLAENG
jgi:dihydrofolate synthase/folylpolyglutamate synthase